MLKFGRMVYNSPNVVAKSLPFSQEQLHRQGKSHDLMCCDTIGPYINEGAAAIMEAHTTRRAGVTTCHAHGNTYEVKAGASH